MSYFPQLVAGPIERASNLLPQLKKNNGFEFKNFDIGMKFIVLGLLQKVIVADNLAAYVNVVYERPEDFHGLQLFLATYFFAFQIYCDFAGYSNIAIGCAKIFGVDLMTNFRRPYLSGSIGEFWQRWHISLSTWFRDYLYIPLGGNRVGLLRNLFNIATVFVLSGLWHGANLTFIFWGGIHSVYLIFERLISFKKKSFQSLVKNRVFSYLRVLFIFNLVTLTWVFFRADSLSDAWIIVNSIFNVFDPVDLTVGLPAYQVSLCFLIIASLLFFEALNEKYDFFNRWYEKSLGFKLFFYQSSLLVFSILYPNQAKVDFIYFQF